MSEPRDDDHFTTEPTDPASKTQPAEGGRDEVEESIDQGEGDTEADPAG